MRTTASIIALAFPAAVSLWIAGGMPLPPIPWRPFAWIIVSAVLATFVVETAFLYVMTAKRVLAEGVAVPLEIRLIARFWLVIGVVADVVFNVLRGSMIFREWPKIHRGELMFSARVQRLVSSSGWRRDKALEWAAVLNSIDPGHIE